ncbi:hypothetical protein CONCODRAFT_51973 [Conidiobolus coronatus NRRL 28638]|uniref:JmjC domain-containing protein n=1 Tax=Conidiobolus coronatus (strain ATCC 28846 / CBS 209.66 / NRRL 28638) TaxID=796925 RepID=A0A137NYX7_CONC2|nr:hypothetical protein CONCODRAFT_51973 [Conidiobolus coronatus NRRL 28638]|eukprot:KXN67932.1 hypothetical protein CONCODRAFT_51973 [Conidiobolus coronatus NRRL 28638]
MNNKVEKSANSNNIDESSNSLNIESEVVSLNNVEKQTTLFKENAKLPEEINSPILNQNIDKSQIKDDHFTNLIRTPEEDRSLEEDLSDLSDLSDLTDLSDLDISTIEDIVKETGTKAEVIVDTDTYDIAEEDLSELDILLKSEEISALAKSFIKTFIKGEYAKNSSLPPIEISKNLLKQLFQEESHYFLVTKNLSSTIILRDKISIKRKNLLKELPKLEDNSDDSSEWTLQGSTCHRLPRDIWCISCVSKQKDICRYKGIRLIARDSYDKYTKAPHRWQKYSDLKQDHEFFRDLGKVTKRLSKFDLQVNEILNYYKVIDKKLPIIKRISITDINESIKEQHLKYLLKQCSTPLKGLIDLQLDLFKLDAIHFKSTPITGQHQCDNCNTTLLNIYFLNTHCGTELCFNCYLMDNNSNISNKCYQTFDHPVNDFIPVTVFPRTVGTVTTLETFFEGFNEILETGNKFNYRKIKDWPAFSEFKTVFPKLYNGFLNALPFKHCTQPDGSLNLASYLPQILNPPDLGPKMYIATGRKDAVNGTTPLHLDAADAVNIMTHSYKSGYEHDNIECAALWHLFDYKDIYNIRQYLAKWAKANGMQNEYHDYIHDQKIYITEPMLKELKRDYGVTAYQIYQNPGDAVFIPAGCAHQVLNIGNCIKVATDFISPERTLQCIHIAKEFSKLVKGHHRNGDIVQTENHILYSSSVAISKLLGIEDELLNYTVEPEESRLFVNKATANNSVGKRQRAETSTERKLARK